MRDSAGGAVSLWVVLMVPALAVAGLAALAIPQRMAAEATVAETAEDLATLAVAWREGSGRERRLLEGFPPDCERTIDEIGAARCRELWEPIATDLGGVGVDTESVAGFYSDSYVTSSNTDSRPPCRISAGSVALDAVHVGLVADWYGGWAASQIWPDGVRLGAEAVGRLNLPAALRTSVDTPGIPPDAEAAPDPDCIAGLDVLNDYGEPGWLRDPGFAGRAMSESVSFRTPFGVIRDAPSDGR
jgi:hypothetical protein